MKRRSLKWLVLCVGLVLAGVSLYIWLAPSGGINRMSVLRIKAGMSHEEVEAVLGLPHGGFANHRYWNGDTGTIIVWFDDDGKVTMRYFSPSASSFFDKVYRWIGIDGEYARAPRAWQR
jgi:hypothetical protein